MRSTTFAIDQGNSSTKVAIFEGSALINHVRLSLGEEQEAIAFVASHHCKGGIVSSVRVDAGLELQQQFGPQIKRMSAALNMPFAIKYTTPHTLGVDRLANCAGALTNHPQQNILIIDCGSCLTITLLNLRTLVGGSISPGLQMRYQALHQFTGRLPQLEPNFGELPLYGDSTHGSMTLGVQGGMLAEIEENIARYCRYFNDLHVIITGGDASYFVARLKSPIFAEPFLTLMGLNEIYSFQNSVCS
jgi:type III pantothenate kinase